MKQEYSGKTVNVYTDAKKGMLLIYSQERTEFTEIKHWKVGGKERKIAFWGEHNQLPQEREFILQDNNIVPELIITKRGIILGKGIEAYRIRYESGKKIREIVEMPPAASDFFESINSERYFTEACGELLKHGNMFIEFIASKNSKITSLRVQPCKRIRAGAQNDKGIIDTYHWHGSWGDKKGTTITTVDTNPAIPIPAWNPESLAPKFIMHLGDPLFYDGYYYWPPYWGGSEWIELSNVIPRFHKANITNGYSIRYHIKIPSNYFLDKFSWETAADENARLQCITDAQAREQEFIDQMNKFLAGESNTGRAVYTKFDIQDEINKEFPGIQILPISADLKDEALLKLFEKSNDANISAQGIHPALSSIQTQGKMSSGSEIRNALLSFIAIKTTFPRKLLMKPINLVKKTNGWPKDIHYGFEDLEITTLDDNPAGRQEVLNE
jgi:hypothetical protein